MKCEEIRSKLQNYVIGEISEEERLAIENHLISCESCQKEIQITRWLFETLDSDVVKEPPVNFVQSVMGRLPERVPTLSVKLLFTSLFLTIGGLFGLGFLFREKLLQFAYNFQTSVARAVSGLDLEAFLENFLIPKIGLIYFVMLGFTLLIATITIIWFARYYWKPVQYRIEPK